MGLFSKDRHGKMSVITEGRAFLWQILDFSKYPCNTTLDSDYVTSFSKHKFHFHMSIGPRGDVGFYLHYRTPPIPKYSYYLENAAGEKMRQQTAHTIPADAERCGHWNIVTMNDMKEFLQRGGRDTLNLYFFFDDDTISREGIDDVRITWRVPQLFRKNLSPLTSAGFSINGSLYVIRMDTKATTNEYVFFVFCRKGTLPPHSLAVTSPDGSIIAQLEKKDELGAQTLIVPQNVLLETVGHLGALQVTLVMFKNANPLDFFNNGGQMGQSPAPKPQFADVGNEQYFVMSDI